MLNTGDRRMRGTCREERDVTAAVDRPALMDAGPAVRALTALSRHRLDRALAAGVSPAVGALHAARAAHLTAPRRRARLAETLTEIVRRVDEPSSLARVAPRAAAVHRNAERIDALARRLGGAQPVYARGVAMLERLLRDGNGPLYRDREGAVLTGSLERVDDALRGALPDAVADGRPGPSPAQRRDEEWSRSRSPRTARARWRTSRRRA